MTGLAGKTALVTGASRGIGRASALALAKAGARVVVHYSRAAKEAEAVVTEICAAGGRADTIAVDLAASDGAHRLTKQALPHCLASTGRARREDVIERIVHRYRPVAGPFQASPSAIICELE